MTIESELYKKILNTNITDHILLKDEIFDIMEHVVTEGEGAYSGKTLVEDSNLRNNIKEIMKENGISHPYEHFIKQLVKYMKGTF